MRAAAKTQKQAPNQNPVANILRNSCGVSLFLSWPWKIPSEKESVKTCYPIFVRAVFHKELQEKSHVAFLL